LGKMGKVMGRRVGRPRTGTGITITLYLNAERLCLLGDDPRDRIFELIDALRGKESGDVGAQGGSEGGVSGVQHEGSGDSDREAGGEAEVRTPSNANFGTGGHGGPEIEPDKRDGRLATG